MATTKKPRTKKAATTSEPTAAATNEPTPRAVLASKGRRTYHVRLVEGASYSAMGHDFFAGRPLVTTDEKIYEALKSNGRFRVDVREEGARR